MNSVREAEALKNLLACGKLPLRAQPACEALVSRLSNPLNIAVLGTEVGPLKTSSLEFEDHFRNPALFDGQVCFFGVSIEPSVQNISAHLLKLNCILVVWLPVAEEFESELEKVKQIAAAGIQVAIIQPPSIEEKLDQYFAFVGTQKKPQPLTDWLAEYISLGQREDKATAQFLLGKYGKSVKIQSSPEPENLHAAKTIRLFMDAAHEVNTDDHTSCFGPAKQVIEGLLQAHFINTSAAFRTDVLAAQDQAVLLELEGTQEAAKTLFAILLQLRREVEQLSLDAGATRLPNFKADKTF